MSVTIDSALTSATYASATDIWPHLDARTLADLCSDTGTRLGSSTDVTAMQTALAASTVFLAKLQAACGKLEAACLKGQRYTQKDLATIAGSGTCTAVYMKELIAWLLAGPVWMRRNDKGEMSKLYVHALEVLKNLETGEEIFGAVEVETAGLPSARQLTATDNLVEHGITRKAGRFFGGSRDLDKAMQGF